VRILCAGRAGVITRQFDSPIISPEVLRVMVVCMSLAVVSEEPVEPLAQRICVGAGRTESPFTDGGGAVAACLEQSGDRHRAGRYGKLPFGLNLTIVSDESMPRVLAGH